MHGMHRVLCAISTPLTTQPTNAKIAVATSAIAPQTAASATATASPTSAFPADADAVHAVSIAPTSNATDAAVAAVPTLARAASHGRRPANTSTTEFASADASYVAARQQVHEP